MERDRIIAACKEAGVVGAGGGGFPTHVKLSAQVGLIIGNGAECDLLVRKDQELMAIESKAIVHGLKLAVLATGSAEGVIALKTKYTRARTALEREMAGSAGLRLFELKDFYPAGDEQTMVYEVTGAVVPEAGLPLDCGVVVQNVETFLNIANAVEGIPVTDKYVNVIGEVAVPGTWKVPLGTLFRDMLELAGGARRGTALIEGGAMMGKLALLEDPVTKTTASILVLPEENPAIRGRRDAMRVITRRGASTCLQCFRCTDMCPRYLLGHALEPHKIIRAVSLGGKDMAPLGALLCCLCGLCTYYACPVGLHPARVTEAVRDQLLAVGARYPGKRTQPNPAIGYRRIPSKRLSYRLGLHAYDVPAPYRGEETPSPTLTLLLKQHVGQPSVPSVKIGEQVHRGQVIAEAAAKGLGVPLHAPSDGVVRAVTPTAIVLEVRG